MERAYQHYSQRDTSVCGLVLRVFRFEKTLGPLRAGSLGGGNKLYRLVSERWGRGLRVLVVQLPTGRDKDQAPSDEKPVLKMDRWRLYRLCETNLPIARL